MTIFVVVELKDKYAKMRKLRKGDKVVITCTNHRANFSPYANESVATVLTSGRKWVTVQLEGDRYEFPYYFDVEGSVNDDVMYGGYKDGSYQIFMLHDCSSIEEYDRMVSENAQKDEIVNEIISFLQKNKAKIPIIKLEEIRSAIKHIDD